MKTYHFISIFLLIGINDLAAKNNTHLPDLGTSTSFSTNTNTSLVLNSTSNSTTSYTTQTVTYCTPTYTIGCIEGDAIKLFRLKGETSVLNQNSGLTCTSSFSDFTTSTPIIDLARGKSYWGKMSVGYVGNMDTKLS